MTNFHSFHMVTLSPWPLLNSINLMNLLLNNTIFFKYKNNYNSLMMLSSFLILLLSLFFWWRDVVRESTFQGEHSKKVMKLLKMSMLLFISSEIMFFSSFFWSFFHFSLVSEMENSNMWPPYGIKMFNPYQIPLLNTIILLSSGATITWSHHAILNLNYKSSLISLTITITFGVIFSFFQLIEYYMSMFNINDNTFGSIFFMTTGFHGFHVIMGTVFLMINLLRLTKSQFNNKHHFSFEAAAWYWHFVDIVWIYLYTFLYWWFWYYY